MFKAMYFCGWMVFDNGAPFRTSRKIWLMPFNTREDAAMLATIYNRIYF